MQPSAIAIVDLALFSRTDTQTDKHTNAHKLLRRRRCFENAKPRRSAGGAQLNRFLGELEGPIRDPVLARVVQQKTEKWLRSPLIEHLRHSFSANLLCYGLGHSQRSACGAINYSNSMKQSHKKCGCAARPASRCHDRACNTLPSGIKSLGPLPSTNILLSCAAGASLRVPPNRSRAGSPRRSAGGARLVDFLC